jgi:hypothetical protein
MKSHVSRAPIRADRVRRVERGFAFVPNRFLHEGFFASLTPNELALYFFLVLAGDHQGVSFYRQARIAALLQLDRAAYLRARGGLLARDLVAFDGHRFQVLSLPASPVLPVPAAPARLADAHVDREEADAVRRLILAAVRPRPR